VYRILIGRYTKFRLDFCHRNMGAWLIHRLNVCEAGRPYKERASAEGVVIHNVSLKVLEVPPGSNEAPWSEYKPS